MLRSLAFACLVAAVACGGGSKNAAPPAEPIANRQPAPEKPSSTASHGTQNDQTLAMLNAFTEQMCACSDAACAKTVSERFSLWTQSEARQARDPVVMSDDEQKVYTQIGMRMGECMANAMGKGSTAPPPPSP